MQIVRIIPEQCKILASAKRAPYLLVYEVADLDEVRVQIHRKGDIYRLQLDVL